MSPHLRYVDRMSLADADRPEATAATDRVTAASRHSILGRPEQLLRVRIHGAHGGPGEERVGSMTTGPWTVDPDGRPTGLASSVLLDHALSRALRDAAPDLDWMVTTELQFNFLRPLPVDGTELDAWTTALSVDPQGGVARSELRDDAGHALLQAVGWFQAVSGEAAGAVDHYARMAALPLGAETAVPLDRLLSMEPSRPVDTSTAPRPTQDLVPGVAFDADEELLNPRGAVHGGILAAMAGLAAQQAMPDRTEFDLQSLRVMFLRPAGGTVRSRTRLRHAGRSLRVLEVELYGDERGHDKPFIHSESVFRTAR